MEIEIAASAYRHGVIEDEMRHAFRNPVFVTDLDEHFIMIVGPKDATGRLIEIGIVPGPMIVHAMDPARHKFLR